MKTLSWCVATFSEDRAPLGTGADARLWPPEDEIRTIGELTGPDQGLTRTHAASSRVTETYATTTTCQPVKDSQRNLTAGYPEHQPGGCCVYSNYNELTTVGTGDPQTLNTGWSCRNQARGGGGAVQVLTLLLFLFQPLSDKGARPERLSGLIVSPTFIGDR